MDNMMMIIRLPDADDDDDDDDFDYYYYHTITPRLYLGQKQVILGMARYTTLQQRYKRRSKSIVFPWR